MRNKATLVATIVAGVAALSTGSAQAVDGAINSTPVTDGPVNAVAYDGSGRAYVGGSFSFVGPRLGSGIFLPGTSDDPAPSFPDVAGRVYAVTSDGAGGWFIGGDFQAVGGVPRNRLAHIHGDGSLDANWNPGANRAVRALALSPTGDALYVGGDFSGANAIGGQSRGKVAKLSPVTGAVDDAWKPAVFGNNAVGVRAIAVSSTGTTVYIGGNFFGAGEAVNGGLAKISASGAGTVDDNWTPNPNAPVNALALSATDLYIGGTFTNVGGQPRNLIAKIDEAGTGAADASWNPGADGPVTALQLDGSDLFVGGDFIVIAGDVHPGLAKLAATGAGDDVTAWQPSPGPGVKSLALSGGELVVGGSFQFISGEFRKHAARVSKTGTGEASSWDPNVNGPVMAIGAGGAGLYLAGDFSSAGDENEVRVGLIRLNPNGSLDKSFVPEVEGPVHALSLSGSELIIGGEFRGVHGTTRVGLAKLNTTVGALDATFDRQIDGLGVYALARSGDDLYVGGDFFQVGTANRNRIAKVSVSANTVASGWDPNAAGGEVRSLALSGSDLFVGGSFFDIDDSGIGILAKVGTGTGDVDTTWDPNLFAPVNALALDGSSLYAGGVFGGRAVKLSTASDEGDPGWTPSPNQLVTALAPVGGSVYVGGQFSQIGGSPRNRLARVSATDGVADAAFEPGASENGGAPHAIAATPTRVLVGGSFNTIGTLSTDSLAIFDLTAPTVSLTSPFEGARFRLNQNVPAAYTCDDPDGAADTVACTGTVPNGSPIDTGSAGAKTFTATATDAGGKSASATVNYVVDASAPDISIAVPADGSVLPPGTQIPVSFSCTDDDGPADVASCVGSAPNGSQLDTSTSGAHTFTVTAADRAGNTSTKTVSYSVPATPPVTPVLRALKIKPAKLRRAPKGKARVTFALTTPARVTFTITRKGKRVGRFTRGAKAGANRFTFRGRTRNTKGKALKPGSYRMLARARTSAGLRSKTIGKNFRIVKR